MPKENDMVLFRGQQRRPQGRRQAVGIKYSLYRGIGGREQRSLPVNGECLSKWKSGFSFVPAITSDGSSFVGFAAALVNIVCACCCGGCWWCCWCWWVIMAATFLRHTPGSMPNADNVGGGADGGTVVLVVTGDCCPMEQVDMGNGCSLFRLVAPFSSSAATNDKASSDWSAKAFVVVGTNKLFTSALDTVQGTNGRAYGSGLVYLTWSGICQATCDGSAINPCYLPVPSSFTFFTRDTLKPLNGLRLAVGAAVRLLLLGTVVVVVVSLWVLSTGTELFVASSVSVDWSNDATTSAGDSVSSGCCSNFVATDAAAGGGCGGGVAQLILDDCCCPLLPLIPKLFPIAASVVGHN